MSVCPNENADTNKPCKVEYTARQVIENKLLARLSDKGSVAILLNEEDLTLVINCLLALRKDVTPPQMFQDAKEMCRDLLQLRKGAFGK